MSLAPHAALSPRQFDVLIRLARGESASKIAEALGISVKTVSTHRDHLLERLMEGRWGVSNAEFAHYCLHHGLIENLFAATPSTRGSE